MSYFGTIYADTELPSRAKAVYMYLRDRSDAEGKCWPGIKTIASDMKLSRSTVKRALHDLEQHGYLKKASRHRPTASSTPTRGKRSSVRERTSTSPSSKPNAAASRPCSATMVTTTTVQTTSPIWPTPSNGRDMPHSR